ncbi:MAG: ECF transporter S component [Candidatus Njordarchaeales archaeon]
MEKTRTREIAITAVLTALSIALALSPMEYPFAPLPFLKFDIAELPVLAVSAMLGPVYALLSTVILALFYVPRDPIGALFKFLAILSTALPLSLVTYVGLKSTRKKLIAYFMGIISIVTRSLIMTLANYVLIPILYIPGIPLETVASWFGMNLFTFLGFIFLFNIIQGAINVIPAVTLVLNLPREWAPNWLRSSD